MKRGDSEEGRENGIGVDGEARTSGCHADYR